MDELQWGCCAAVDVLSVLTLTIRQAHCCSEKHITVCLNCLAWSMWGMKYMGPMVCNAGRCNDCLSSKGHEQAQMIVWQL